MDRRAGVMDVGFVLAPCCAVLSTSEEEVFNIVEEEEVDVVPVVCAMSLSWCSIMTETS